MAEKRMPLPILDRNQLESLAQKRCENERLKEMLREKDERLEALNREKEELTHRLREVREASESKEVWQQVCAVEDQVRKTERQWEIVAQKREEGNRLRERIAELKQRKEEKLKEIEKMSVYHDFLERVVKMTTFKDVHEFANHLENLLNAQDEFSQKETSKLAEVEQKNKELRNLEHKHHVTMAHKDLLQSKLQTELERDNAEALIWQKKYDKIQETAAKKTLMLAQMKMAILNLFEVTEGTVRDEEVDVNDTDTQLDRIASFILDHNDIIKQFQLSQQKEDKPRGKSINRKFKPKK